MYKNSGVIELYSGGYEMVARMNYRYASQRAKIIKKWEKRYRLQDKLYFLIIKPNDDVKDQSEHDEGVGEL
jgi:hypothetical protein